MIVGACSAPCDRSPIGSGEVAAGLKRLTNSGRDNVDSAPTTVETIIYIKKTRHKLKEARSL